MIEIPCHCEKGVHRAPLEEYIIEPGAIRQLNRVLSDYRKIYIVCDENTYAAAGRQAEQILSAGGRLSHTLILKKGCLPNCETVGNILIHLHDPKADADIFAYSPQPDLILAVGSGTINDSCRLVSFRTHIPYAVLGTAPSMDGYASAGSPILFDGTKATIKATTPKYIIADTDIMKDAPFDMLLAGIGDMFGKYTGILDWELARDYAGEYFCEKIAADVIKATDSCLENGYLLGDRHVGVIKKIMEGFMVTGLGMAYTGNSRPASGSEHIIAHAWELEDVNEGVSPHLHGLEVCQATRIVADMYRLLLRETDDDHLKALIAEYIPYFDAVERFCVKMNMPIVTADRAKILGGIHRALTLRDRYTILFYLRDRGDFDRYAEYATDEFLKKAEGSYV